MNGQAHTVQLNADHNSVITVAVKIGVTSTEPGALEQACCSENIEPIKKRRRIAEANEDILKEECSVEVPLLTSHLHQILKNRLDDANVSEKTKMKIYEEWIYKLIKINNLILDNNNKLLSKEIEEYLHKTDEQIQVMKDKYSEDVVKLIQMICIARDTGEWNTDVEFDTVSTQKLFDEYLQEELKKT